MKYTIRAAAIAGMWLIVAACTTMAPPATVTTPTAVMDRQAVDALVSTWPETARKAAGLAMDRYGVPDGVTETMLVWHDNGPWKRTVVYREEVPHDFPMPHMDVWEQFVDYQVPIEMFDDLAAYDGSVIVERTKGVMSARCDREEANFLAVNLADDIVRGRRTVDDARRFYAQTIKNFKEGESSPYIEGLRFRPMMAAGDPDQPAAIFAARR